MTPSEATNAATREEWRDLGIYYELDKQQKHWILVGSPSGVERFADALLQYARNPRNSLKSEHDHFGPYMYLKVMTWPERGIDEGGIRGSQIDIEELAGCIRRAVAMGPGTQVKIAHEYMHDPEFEIVIDVREEGLDPSSLDPVASERSP